MSKPLFNCATFGKGRYKLQVVERAICLRIAKKVVRSAGYEHAFELAHGHRFTGSGEDRMLLPAEIREKVDAALRKSMRRYPAQWRKAPVARIPVDLPEADNIILNQGLDYLGAGTAHWGNMGMYCVLGTGTATPAFTDTGLGAEIIRTNNELTSGTSTTDDVGTRTRTMRRTYDFPAEGSTSFAAGERSGHNYTEIGLSHSAVVTNNLSTRALIASGTVTAVVGQQVRAVYSIAVTLGANTVSTPTSSTGWTAGLQGTSAFCTFGGTSDRGNGGNYAASKLLLATGSTIPSFGTSFSDGTTSNAGTSGLNPYTTGTYKRTRWSRWALAEGVGTWRSLEISTGFGPTQNAWCWVFDNAQTKDNLHVLTITWSMSYGRA